MDDNFTKLKMLWDDRVTLMGLRVIQFLMGLNESYNVTRDSILMKSPLHSVGQVCSLLLHEETQGEILSTSNFMTDSASLNANSSRYYGQYGEMAISKEVWY